SSAWVAIAVSVPPKTPTVSLHDALQGVRIAGYSPGPSGSLRSLRAAASVPAPFRSSFLDPARQGDELTATVALRARSSTADIAITTEGSESSAPVPVNPGRRKQRWKTKPPR